MNRPNLKSRLFHLWFRISRPMTLGVRILVQDEKGAVLLVRHGYVKGWHLPGGGVEAGDTGVETVAKELREETGLQCESSPKLFNIYANQRVTKRDHVLLYKVGKWSRAEAFVANAEIREIGFFALDELPQETTQPTRDRLAEMFDGKDVSQIW